MSTPTNRTVAGGRPVLTRATSDASSTVSHARPVPGIARVNRRRAGADRARSVLPRFARGPEFR